MRRIAVMGSGSWGTGFGMVLADAGGDVAMWAREPDVVRDINQNHTNSGYHAGIELPPAMWASGDPEEVLRGAEIVVLAIPSQTLRENLSAWKTFINPDATLVSLMKGIELGTIMRMSQVIAEVTGVPDVPGRCRVGPEPRPRRSSSGSRRRPPWPAPTKVRAQSDSQEASTTAYFRPYFTTDVVGHRDRRRGEERDRAGQRNGRRAGFGENAQASLITRGLAEMSRLGAALGGQSADLPRPGRHRRPDRDLYVAAVAQPHVRREPRPGTDPRRDDREDEADLRRREELPGDPGPRPPATASRCRSPNRWSRSCTTKWHRGRCWSISCPATRRPSRGTRACPDRRRTTGCATRGRADVGGRFG